MRWPEIVELELGLDEPDDDAGLRARVAKKLGANAAELPVLVVRRRSIDSRHGKIRFLVAVELVTAELPPLALPEPREVNREPRVVIVGDGPAGLFCAYELARHGIGCTVIDRGRRVQPRRRDLKGLNRHGIVDADSNYCFGEGGAGTYSDGKLYTRADKRGNVRDVLEILARHGAPLAILSDARPHIGSNRLPNVVTALREHLEQVGVGFVFEKRVVRLLERGQGSERAIAGVVCADGTAFEADHVVLATGHSARDVQQMLLEMGEKIEAKAFAVGARIEHPQPLINQIQYGKHAGHPRLPSAAYRLANTVADSKVFSFCMCPGGFIVPAATERGALVVNGMSLSKRNSPYANSGLVVGIEPAQVAAAGFTGELGGTALQARIEQAAYSVGGAMLKAPATRVTDFLARRASTTVPSSSYIPGLEATDLEPILNAGGIDLAAQLRRALTDFGRKLRGYVSEEAVLVGVESRTSSPVRVVRDPETLMSTRFSGLYPCGEGAGYAGGIVSAAMDGINVARKIAANQ